MSFKELNSIEIVIKLLSNYLSEIRFYESELINNKKNSEDLHQFRVNIRKTLTLLYFLKNFFDPIILKQYKTFLKSLLSLTNSKRDLDVYLSFLKQFSNSCSVEDIEKLNILKKYAKKDIKIEGIKIIKYLSSEEYKDMMFNYNDFITNKKSYDKKLNDKKIEDIIVSLFDSHIGKIDNSLSMLYKESPSWVYHKIRIKFKKLRYISEVYFLLNQSKKSKELKNFIKKIKDIQRLFGEFQDLSVQQKILANIFSKYEIDDLENIKKEFSLRESGLKEAIVESVKFIKEVRLK